LKVKWLSIVFTLLLVPASVCAQSFSSGSTGADGALDLTLGDRNVQLPESGILNYTTINIPAGRQLDFTKNFRNTPVIMLAQGNVTIAGTIFVGALGGTRTPGPGGFYGGAAGSPGFGPGGGAAVPGNANDGKWVGSLSLVPIIGGSGAGGYVGNPCDCFGGGGGGAIVIASSASITLQGAIYANGASGVTLFGSGGAIRLVANSISVSGTLQAFGRVNDPPGLGVIRFEAPAGSLFFSGTAKPQPILSTTINPQIISDTNTPALSIVTIGGFPVSYTAGRPDSVDLILPNQVSDPINVGIQAHNIPVGTQVNLNISGPATGTFTPGTLSGTQASSSATIGVSGLSRTGSTYIIAFADFTLPPAAAKLNRKGPDQIAKVRVIAKPGKDSQVVFLRRNGTEIDSAKVSKAIQQQFGLN
jgi:hypothetical protein